MKRYPRLIALLAVCPLLMALKIATPAPKGDNAGTKPPAKEQMVACPMYAKLCPDGSSVSPQGPKCEVPACPGGDGPVKPPVTEEAPPAATDEPPVQGDDENEEGSPNQGCDDKDGCD